MRRDEGFTLVELVITMVILGIIGAAISTAIVVGLRTTDATQTRLAQSHDRQMTPAFFITDVQSSDDVSLSDTTCSGVIPVVRFQWTDQGVVKVAAYAIVAAENERQLRRYYCEDSVVINTSSVVHNLSVSVNPVLVCTPACPGTSTPSKVTLTITDTSGASFDVVGSRRVG
ncbi:MAG: prepilin-type N-terminal cleavage/methylation domain-containing protein [Actinomycetota bacterium]